MYLSVGKYYLPVYVDIEQTLGMLVIIFGKDEHIFHFHPRVIICT